MKPREPRDHKTILKAADVGINMRLIEAIENIERFNNDHTMYVTEPWSKESFAVNAIEPDSDELPNEAGML